MPNFRGGRQAVRFAIHSVFKATTTILGYGLKFDAPVLASVDRWALLLSAAAALLIFRFKVGMLPTLALCAGAGVVGHLAGAL